MSANKWRLPHGVNELLPPAAAALESLRRAVLDLFRVWGYEHVEPPLVEYLDALLVGSGADLDLQTMKVVDQQSGRLLGVRADMTSQAVRVDSHSRKVNGVQRLCYAGAVVHANPRGALDGRIIFKAGAELFGSDARAADAEVVRLMLEALRVAGVDDPVLMLGHTGVFRALVSGLTMDGSVSRQLFDAVQRKSESDIAALVRVHGAPEALVTLPTLMGGEDVLDAAARQLGDAFPGILDALAELKEVVARVRAEYPGVVIRFDLGELSGYGYHNGLVFAAFQADQGAAIAQGGRYDGIGAHFGRARPATGFDMDLGRLLRAGALPAAIWAPVDEGDGTLRRRVSELRNGGEVVVQALDKGDIAPQMCVQELVKDGNNWVLRARHGV
ncbi:MAG: ATP phosphoribosyltransferase regulatory subunit [Pseudomonadales bacterium]|nr:ATP phosphoribosyltransferase regulatory subunit [Pseudomonadales bacterium]MCP5183297.1 ATP phosphoribosyltransferase regulatory subunit [Pseudomonadales bacterium]